MAKSLKAKFIIQDGYSRVMERFERVTKKFQEQVEKASRKTDQLEQKIKGFGQRVTSIWNKLTGLWNGSSYSGIFKMVKAFMALKAVQLIVSKIVDDMKKMDLYMNTLSRLKLINDGTHTNEQFNDKIFAAANRSKGSYQGMAESVAKMGMLAKNRFSSNDELIGFTELVQKSFRLGGADTTAQQSAMLQLSQAMASGRLQGDEYVSILENAPLIAKAIADYTGVGEEGLKKLSSEGLITADVVKNAVFSMSKDINSEFEKLPNLWGDYWNRITNETTRAFGKVMNTISKLINTDTFKTFIDWIVECIYVVAGAINWLLESVMSGISWIVGIISTGVRWIKDKIISAFTEIVNTESFQTFMRSVLTIFYMLGEKVHSFIQSIGSSIQWIFNVIVPIIAWIFSVFSSVLRTIKNKIDDVLSLFSDPQKLKPFAENILTIFYAIVEGISWSIQFIGNIISYFASMIWGLIFVIGAVMSGIFNVVATVILWIVDFIIEHFDIISSILWACLIVGIYFLIAYLWGAIPPLLTMVAGWIAQAGAILLVKAQLLASLIPAILKTAATWFLAHAPVILIIILIAGLICIAKKMGITFGDVIGGIAAVFSVFYTFVYNIVIGIKNIFADLGNVIYNSFKNSLSSAKLILHGFAIMALGYIRDLAEGIENFASLIPGMESFHITGKIDTLIGNLSGKANQLLEEIGWEEKYKQEEFLDYGEVASEWYNKSKNFIDNLIGKLKDKATNVFKGAGDEVTDIFKGLGDKFSGFLDQFKSFSDNPYESKDLSKEFGKNLKPYIPGSGAGKPQKVKGIGRNGAIKVEMDKEDVKFLRDMAERDFVANIRHKTLAPNINVNFTGPISRETDTDKLYKRITKILKTQIAMAGEN